MRVGSSQFFFEVVDEGTISTLFPKLSLEHDLLRGLLHDAAVVEAAPSLLSIEQGTSGKDVVDLIVADNFSYVKRARLYDVSNADV